MRKLSAVKAADQIATLIQAGHYKTAEEVVKRLPELQPGLDEYKNRQTATRSSGSGNATLSRW